MDLYSPSVSKAFKAMSADELRALMREIWPSLSHQTQLIIISELITRNVESTPSGYPSGPSAERVEEIERFALLAQQQNITDADEVDEALYDGELAFLAGDYEATIKIFKALLPPLGNAEIDLGQEELIDEELAVSIDKCADRYVASIYMTSPPEERASHVLSAMKEMRHVGYFFTPLSQLQQVAIEPLPELERFLGEWHALLTSYVREIPAEHRRHEEAWLREATQAAHGLQGLAELARESKRPDDLKAWCKALEAIQDWKGARAAYEEAAEIIIGHSFEQGQFLDQAARIAQQLGTEDSDEALERAWRKNPNLQRLQAWLETSSNQQSCVTRAQKALEGLSPKEDQQRALLYLFTGDIKELTALLSVTHERRFDRYPEHLIFLYLITLLESPPSQEERSRCYTKLLEWMNLSDWVSEELIGLSSLLRFVPSSMSADHEALTHLLSAMKEAIERYAQTLVEAKKRQSYDHVARLAALCVRLEDNVQGAQVCQGWLQELLSTYSRYPALKAALIEHLVT